MLLGNSLTMSVLPFSQLSNLEFLQMFSDVDLGNQKYDLERVLMYNDVYSDSQQESDFGNDVGANILVCNKSEYITVEELSLLNISRDSLTLLQVNCRSLKKIMTNY
jgi:hypothetical protein